MYRIKYLVHRKDDDMMLQDSKPVTKTVAYSDADIGIASCHWKSMGFKRIMEIEVLEKDSSGNQFKPKLTAAEIIELFYAPIGKVNGKDYETEILPVDLKVKAELVKKYGGVKKTENPLIDPESGEGPEVEIPDWKKSEEAEKAFRKDVLYVKLKENEISFSHNTGTQKLIDKLKTAGIEV